MTETRDRRTFLGWLGLAGGTAALGASARGAGQDEDKGRRRGWKAYSGTSTQGDPGEALRLAIQAALKAQPGADRQIAWRLKEVTGRQGGIKPLDEVTVTIEARLL